MINIKLASLIAILVALILRSVFKMKKVSLVLTFLVCAVWILIYSVILGNEHTSKLLSKEIIEVATVDEESDFKVRKRYSISGDFYEVVYNFNEDSTLEEFKDWMSVDSTSDCVILITSPDWRGTKTFMAYGVPLDDIYKSYEDWVSTGKLPKPYIRLQFAIFYFDYD